MKTLISLAILGQLIVGFILTQQKQDMQKMAIERGVASYNPSTGGFEWSNK